MATLEDFLPDVLPHCAGVPAPLAERAVLHALREFCTRSGYLRATATFETVTDESATGEYTLAPVAGLEVASVVTPIEHGTVQPRLVTEEWLAVNYRSDWRTVTGDEARYFVAPAKTVVRLVPYPTTAVAGDLRVSYVVRPALTSPTIDDLLLEEWSEAIGWGAQARLKMEGNKPWSDANGAAAKLEMFADAVDKAFSMGLAGQQDRKFQRQRRVTGHYF